MERVQNQTHHVAVLTHEAKSLYSAYVGEVMSLIYNPVYIRNQAIYDGIVHRPVARYAVERQPVFEQAPGSPGWEFGFVPALCPGCGWDLEGERDSVVFLCRNCETAWTMSSGRFQPVPFGVSARPERGDYLLPFWSMRFRFNGVTLETYADLVRLTNLPRVVQPEWEARELHFWIPAFRVAPSHYQRLSQKITVLQPEKELTRSVPRTGVHPVTLDVDQAAEGVRVALGSISVAKQRVLPLLQEIQPRLESTRLTYLAFADRGRDFYHRETNTSLPRNAFRGHTPGSA